MLPIPMLSLDPRSLRFNTLTKPLGPIKMAFLDEPLTLQLPDALRIMYKPAGAAEQLARQHPLAAGPGRPRRQPPRHETAGH
jgi:hypothetical protein